MMINKRIPQICAAAIAALLFFIPLTAGPTPQPSRNPAFPGTFADVAGLYVIDLSTGEVISEMNGNRQFIPASVTKAVTTATVMCLKDSSERFVTPVVALGKVSRGTLDGNVVVSCSGDPTIESRHFGETHGIADSIAAGLKSLGIYRITGKVIIDKAAFHDSGIPAGWMAEDLTEPYGAELQAANFADNCVGLRLPSAATSPSTPGIKIETKGGKGRARLSRDRNSRNLTLTGAIPRKGLSVRIANPQPSSTLLAAIERKLSSEGIEVEHGNVKPKGGTELVYTHVSPRFVDIMRSLMVRSDNLMAEGMLRTLAPGDSRDEALGEELDTWRDNDIDLSGVVLEDGSGLSRNNRMTPRFLCEVLEWMAGSLVAPSYVRLFPRTGSEGTVRNFLKGTPLEGHMVLKTGSMRGVQSYAGYYIGDAGVPTHAVVVMANNFKCDRGRLRSTITDVLMEIFAPQAAYDENATENGQDIPEFGEE